MADSVVGTTMQAKQVREKEHVGGNAQFYEMIFMKFSSELIN